MADENEQDREDWLVTYADAITLLMAFFVMLLTFAEYDIPAFEEAAAAIANAVGNRNETSPTSELQIILQDVVYNLEADQVVTVSKDKKGLVLELASNAFFVPGEADLRPEAIPVLQKMAQAIAAPRYDFYLIETEGHTDDDPISTVKFPSNWELSAGRASTVVRYLETENISPFRMKASGYASTRPKVANRNPDGTAIKENQALNRRVNLRVYPMSLDQRTEIEALITMSTPQGDVDMQGQTEEQVDTPEDDSGGTSSVIMAPTDTTITTNDEVQP